MNVASIELCRQLYMLSGWDGSEYAYCRNGGQEWRPWNSTEQSDYSTRTFQVDVPAYDLSYLLDKIPSHHLKPMGELFIVKKADATYRLWYTYVYPKIEAEDANPCDAACKLAIELIKRRAIKPVDNL